MVAHLKSKDLQTLSPEFLQVMLDHLPVALFCKDASNDFRFTAWNKQSENIFGIGIDEVKNKSDYDLFPKEQADFFRKKDIQTMQEGKIVEIEVEPVDSPAFGTRYVRTLKVPIYDEQNRPRYLLGICEDITERRKIEKALEKEQLRALAASKMAALGEMAGSIAHEINNPLQLIISRVEHLKTLAKKNVPGEELKEHLDKIESTTLRISKIVKGLRSYSRNADADPFSETSLKSMMNDAVELCSRRFFNHEVELDVVAFQDQIIECRSAHIVQIIVNLLNNAFDAVHALSEKWVRLTVEDLGSKIQIVCTDSGDGVPSEVRCKIMDPFFTTKGAGIGVGLGLSISKDLAEEHNGKLSLNNTSTKTQFILELPKKQT